MDEQGGGSIRLLPPARPVYRWPTVEEKELDDWPDSPLLDGAPYGGGGETFSVAVCSTIRSTIHDWLWWLVKCVVRRPGTSDEPVQWYGEGTTSDG